MLFKVTKYAIICYIAVENEYTRHVLHLLSDPNPYFMSYAIKRCFGLAVKLSDCRQADLG